MQVNGLDVRRASFTVEAVFVVSICLWVILGICYLSLYAHDCTALYSLGENFLEVISENGQEIDEAGAGRDLEEYLQKHMMICRVTGSGVNKNLLSVEAEIEYEVNIQIPYIKALLADGGVGTLRLTHGRINPAGRMWDAEIFNRNEGRDEN